MALKPNKNDPNYKEEIKRFRRDPKSFGDTTPNERPEDWKPTGLANKEKKRK